MSKQTRMCSAIAMNHLDLKEINTYELAKKEAEVILSRAGINHLYSHSVYALLSWLIPATIGLTYHQMIRLRGNDREEVIYEDIFQNLKDYFNADCCPIVHGLYENNLEYNFYKMGMDLFEAGAEGDVRNITYCQAAMDDWYSFKSALIKSPTSPIYCELCVAIVELANSR